MPMVYNCAIIKILLYLAVPLPGHAVNDDGDIELVVGLPDVGLLYARARHQSGNDVRSSLSATLG